MNENERKQAAARLMGILLEMQRIAASDAPNDIKAEALAESLGMQAEITAIPDLGAYMEQRAQTKGLIRPCVNPYCATDNGNRATVDLRKKKSGACCKACMNYACDHPDCVKKAQQNGWMHYTHTWGTKIAEQHKDYRHITPAAST